ncbi:branched-chain amino acid ABC transporter substrate-binding protein [Streptosporangium sp. NBC_01639]|uniref:branched-chain amino acid ABC transporter substrate-binding protein n=1 Tax=Streptosporangium sp. NBC_01639 TaxID=2975948 RepID=UPI00386BFACF|nr:branched-chain amino acid ABC transporter substrate-binding protein [Streptosporangium sp. NBC_01639]
MRGVRRLTALAVTALLAAASGCGGTGALVPEPGRCGLRIAFFGPLTGESMNLGRNMHEGALLAVERHNAGNPACTVGLVAVDSQGDPKQAPELAQRVVADPTIVGVVGPAFSGESQAGNPILNQGGVSTITPAATEPRLSDREWSVFHRIMGSDAAQGPAAGSYIRETLRARKVFVIDDASPYGHGLSELVMKELGPLVVQSSSIQLNLVDFHGLAAEVESAAPDVVFFGGYYAQAGQLLRELRDAGVTATFVSGDAVKEDGFVRTAGAAAAEGAVLICPCRPPEKDPEFARQYRARFGHEPGTYSAEAYDAATVFLRGIDAGSTRRPDMEKFVDDYSGTGITTEIRFNDDGELVDPSVTVWAYRIHNGQIVADDKPIPRN